jgi:hypothetical protein
VGAGAATAVSIVENAANFFFFVADPDEEDEEEYGDGVH